MSLKLALTTTVGLCILGLPICYWLYHNRRSSHLVLSIINLPMVLPPTVLGFYILLLYSQISFIGIHLSFSFTGLVIASLLFNLPFFINPIINGLEELPHSILKSSYILGKSRHYTFYKVLLPNAKTALITAISLSFAHTMGEFGVILMIGGSIPNETEVASIAVFREVETLNYANAHGYALILVAISLSILIALQILKGKMKHAHV